MTVARHRESRQLSGWKDDMGHPEQHRAAPGRCPLGREVFPDRYRIFTDEILSTQAGRQSLRIVWKRLQSVCILATCKINMENSPKGVCWRWADGGRQRGDEWHRMHQPLRPSTGALAGERVRNAAGSAAEGSLTTLGFNLNYSSWSIILPGQDYYISVKFYS